MNRPSGRQPDQARDVKITRQYTKHAEGSVLVEFGDTKVICNASIDESVPRFLKGEGQGWVTAEYGMLPRSTSTRMDREASRGKQSGRTQEIQRVIGRSLRAIVDLKKLGELQVRIDCDVLQADGGTRTASITGAYMALRQAISKCMELGHIDEDPIIEPVSAISCGIYEGSPVLDLDYSEDSSADADTNFVLTPKGIVEIQATAESTPFKNEEFTTMMDFAMKGTNELFVKQQAVLDELLKKAA